MEQAQIQALEAENQRLREDNRLLLAELAACRRETAEQIAVLTSVKKELRRNEVQLNSLKTENQEFKNKFAKIENNPLGRLCLKLYRLLRELKRRRG